jgi:hypothetical protein
MNMISSFCEYDITKNPDGAVYLWSYEVSFHSYIIYDMNSYKYHS